MGEGGGVSDFVTLPIIFPSVANLPQATHYLYLKHHDPKIPDQDAPRSLFLVNLPVLTTDAHIRHLFGTQLGSGRVERVDFSEEGASTQTSDSATKSSRKRKRLTAEEVEAGLDSHRLPKVFDVDLQCSGASAIVVFVDRPSAEASLKAVRKAAKNATRIIWGVGLKDNDIPTVGLKRYEEHNKLQYPSRRDLLRSVDAYMTAYAQLEETRSKENARKRQMPDEDGFVTVTRGSRGGAVNAEEAKELATKHKAKSKGLEDFYRFQMRERKKEEHQEMLKKFEEDKRKVAEMRQRRGKLRPET